MNEKKKTIIESAIKLFAAKGFSSTSIQEITTECGISKGAFYIYFKSKDSLLISILEYYFEEFHKNVFKFNEQHLSAREKFSKQLSAMVSTFISHKEFIIMQAREEAIPLNDEVKELLSQVHVRWQKFYKQSLLSIYGQKVEPTITDLMVMFDGIFQSYTKILLLNPTAFQPDELAHYIMKRLDSIVIGLAGEQALLSEDIMCCIHRSSKLFSSNEQSIKEVLHDMEGILAGLENKEDLEVSLEVLKAEIDKRNPRIPVIQGMLSNFNHVQALDVHRKKISDYYQIKLK